MIEKCTSNNSNLSRVAIQLAKLSGFNPIITTASTKHEEFLKSLGATHVLDRNESLSDLKASISKTTDQPAKVVVDTISSEETQTLGFNLLAPGGQLAIDNAAIDLIKEEGPKQNKSHVFIFANKQGFAELVQEMWTHVTGFLRDGDLKVR
jgi:NADPH:quinone reductase-like Zn-dependent oxidoreductase